MNPEIYPIKRIGNGLLSIMAKPVSGEFIDTQFLAIANVGIHQIVSLLEPIEARQVGLQNEAQLAHKNGMAFISFPIKDHGLPASIKLFSNFTQKHYQQISDGKNTVVHCYAGIGRSGLVAAATLMHYGFSVETAFHHISKHRGVGVPDTPEQESWLKKNCNLLHLDYKYQ